MFVRCENNQSLSPSERDNKTVKKCYDLSKKIDETSIFAYLSMSAISPIQIISFVF